MANFYFKKFVVRQSGSAMKVNTDGVLLPAWVSLPQKQILCENLDAISKDVATQFKVLDIGSGTGVISLIVAQRLSESKFQDNFGITAIDIDHHSYLEGQFNFENSNWKEQLEAFHISLQDYSVSYKLKQNPILIHNENSSAKIDLNLNGFDLILSNPPFFTNSLKAPSQARSNARHSHSLPLSALLEASASLISDGGTLAIILPVVEGEALLEMATKGNQFVVKRLCKVKTLLNKPVKRYMIELQKTQISDKEQAIKDSQSQSLIVKGCVLKEEILVMQEETLVMQEEGGEFYTQEYNELVKSFYLKDLKIKSI